MTTENKAFALIGDRYHNADYIRTALGKTLVRDHGLPIDFSDEVTQLNADTLEQHFMVCDKDPDHVLAESVNDDGHTFKELGSRCQAAWTYDYGKGRATYLAPGHTVPALWNPAYEKMQHNAVRWLSRQT